MPPKLEAVDLNGEEKKISLKIGTEQRIGSQKHLNLEFKQESLHPQQAS